MSIFRWHISRKPEGRGRGWIDVTITPAAGRFAQTFGALRLRGPAELPSESLASWKTGRDSQLEGATTEDALLRALASRNAVDREAARAVSREGRRLVEDMVFLQVVDDEKAYTELWEKLVEAGDWPDVTDLVEFPGARWLDYTRASRRMARNLYVKVLGEEEARGPTRGKGESNA
jgi:hypothetical protein